MTIDDDFNNACGGGNLAEVKRLYEAGADVEWDHNRPLWAASYYGHMRIVEFLLDHGADIHARHDRALISASSHGRANVVEFLLARGADVHAEHDDALISAATNGHTIVAEMLLNAGANVNTQHGDALYRAEYNNHVNVVDLLLKRGANAESIDRTLKAAVQHGHGTIIDLLQKRMERDVREYVGEIVNDMRFAEQWKKSKLARLFKIGDRIRVRPESEVGNVYDENGVRLNNYYGTITKFDPEYENGYIVHLSGVSDHAFIREEDMIREIR